MQAILSEEQRQALAAGRGGPLSVVDPATNREYVLVPADAWQRVRGLIEPAPPSEQHGGTFEVPPGIRQSQEAFRRDLPAFLEDPKLRGRWVLYRGDERIGFASTQRELIRECLRRGWKNDEYYVGKVIPCELDEVEEIERSLYEFDEIDSDTSPGRLT
jgi:hypothetical protein